VLFIRFMFLSRWFSQILMALKQFVSVCLRPFGNGTCICIVFAAVSSPWCLQHFKVSIFQSATADTPWFVTVATFQRFPGEGSLNTLRSNLPFTCLLHVWLGTFSPRVVCILLEHGGTITNARVNVGFGNRTVHYINKHMFGKRDVLLVRQRGFTEGILSPSFQVQTCGPQSPTWQHLIQFSFVCNGDVSCSWPIVCAVSMMKGECIFLCKMNLRWLKSCNHSKMLLVSSPKDSANLPRTGFWFLSVSAL